jgi:hypothetical protein
MAKVEAAVDPYAVVGDVDVFLRRNRPLPFGRHPFSLRNCQKTYHDRVGSTKRKGQVTFALCLRIMFVAGWRGTVGREGQGG